MRAAEDVGGAGSGVRRTPLAYRRGQWRRPRGWNAAVATSAAIVIAVVLVTGIGWLASSRAGTSTYSYPGAVTQIDLRLSSGDAVIVGSSSSSVEVRRTDHYAFGHAARERRSLANSVLQISSACPRIVLGSCSAAYELAVPETVAIHVETKGGNVRLEGFRGSASVQTDSGNVDAEAYCGFELSARSQSGHLRVGAACAPEHLQLQTGSGDAVALVPPGRYRIDASGAHKRISGLISDPSAPFTLDVSSKSGGVTVGGGL
jgi:hypothetical protein